MIRALYVAAALFLLASLVLDAASGSWPWVAVEVVGLVATLGSAANHLRRRRKPPEPSPYVERERIGW